MKERIHCCIFETQERGRVKTVTVKQEELTGLNKSAHEFGLS